MSRREVSLLFLSSLVDCECLTYRGFSPYANFITSNFITAVFQNYYYNFANAILWAILLVRSLAKNLANTIFG